MLAHIIQTLMGAIGAVGFAILFNVRGKKLGLLFLGGALDWTIYLLLTCNGYSIFTGMFFATVTAAVLSEILARVLKAPVLMPLVPMLIPLIPGGSLYHTMSNFVRGENQQFLHYARQTVTEAGAIALGIIAVAAVSHILQYLLERKHKA